MPKRKRSTCSGMQNHLARNYSYRGYADNHNSVCHDGRKQNSKVGSENVRITRSRAIGVFAFFIACTEINSYSCLEYILNFASKHSGGF